MKALEMALTVILLSACASGFEYTESLHGIENTYVVYNEINCTAQSNSISCLFKPYSDYSIRISFQNDEIERDFCLFMTSSGVKPSEVSGLRAENVRGMEMMCMGGSCDPMKPEDCFVSIPGKGRRTVRIEGETGKMSNKFHLSYYYRPEDRLLRRDFDLTMNIIADTGGNRTNVSDTAVAATTTTEAATEGENPASLGQEVLGVIREHPGITVMSVLFFIAVLVGVMHYVKND